MGVGVGVGGEGGGGGVRGGGEVVLVGWRVGMGVMPVWVT